MHFDYQIRPGIVRHSNALALMRAAQSWAFVSGRDHVQPEDIQAVLPSVAEHRLRGGMEDHGRTHSLTTQLLKAVDVIG